MNWIRFVIPVTAFAIAGSCSLEPAPQEFIPPVSFSLKLKSVHLPTKCRQFLTDPKKSEWNPTTHVYTTDGAWAVCMGVGIRKAMYREDI